MSHRKDAFSWMISSAALALLGVCRVDAASTCTNPSQAAPQDTYYLSEQWPHQNPGGTTKATIDADMDTPLAWECTLGRPEVVIAIVDTDGIFSTHPDLVQNRAGSGRDFTVTVDQPPPPAPHGTGVTGLAVAAANAIGIRGSCPMCRFLPIRADKSTIAQAIAWAGAQGARIVAIPPFSGTVELLDQAVMDQISQADPKLIIITGAGNLSQDVCGGQFLQRLNNVMTVSSSTSLDTRAVGDPPTCISGGTKCQGNGIGKCVDLLAPSWHEDGCGDDLQNIPATCTRPVRTTNWNPQTGATYQQAFGGTSASRPLAAGVAGLLLSVRPELTRLELQRLLQDTADKIEPSKAEYDRTTGYSSPGTTTLQAVDGELQLVRVDLPSTHAWGRLNAFEAVRIVAPGQQTWWSGGQKKWRGGDGVDLFVRDNDLDWGNTEQPSDTKFEPTSGPQRPTIPCCDSPDIKADSSSPPAGAPQNADEFDAFSEAAQIDSAKEGRVYVRIRNRGPDPASGVSVRLYWAWAGPGGGVPDVPNQFWSHYTNGSADLTPWHAVQARIGGPPNPGPTPQFAYPVPSLAYSGASVAHCASRQRPDCEPASATDDARIASFMVHTSPLQPGQTMDLYLLAIVESPQDPLGNATKVSLSPGLFAPRDNNVTLKRIAVKAPS